MQPASTAKAGRGDWDPWADPREKARRKNERQRASMPIEERRLKARSSCFSSDDHQNSLVQELCVGLTLGCCCVSFSAGQQCRNDTALQEMGQLKQLRVVEDPTACWLLPQMHSPAAFADVISSHRLSCSCCVQRCAAVLVFSQSDD